VQLFTRDSLQEWVRNTLVKSILNCIKKILINCADPPLIWDGLSWRVEWIIYFGCRSVYKICRSIFVHVCTKIFESLCRVVHYQKDLLINFCAGICAILCRNLCHFCADLCTIRNCAENCALSEKINLFYNTNFYNTNIN